MLEELTFESSMATKLSAHFTASLEMSLGTDFKAATSCNEALQAFEGHPKNSHFEDITEEQVLSNIAMRALAEVINFRDYY